MSLSAKLAELSRPGDLTLVDGLHRLYDWGLSLLAKSLITSERDGASLSNAN
jgi:hypothetical protein